MKSSPRLTGRPGGLAVVNDGLTNVVTGMGTARDRNVAMQWGPGAGSGIADIGIDRNQIEYAYLRSGLVRKLHDLAPEEMTKNWRTFSLKADQIDAIRKEEKRLNIRHNVREALRLARLAGGCGLVLGLPGPANTKAPTTVGPLRLRYAVPFTRHQLTFDALDRDIQSPWFMQPRMFRLQTGDGAVVDVHPSRVIAFRGSPGVGAGGQTNDVDLFWGHPLMESLNASLMHATLGQVSIANLFPEAITDTISIPGLTDMVSTSEGESRLANRLIIASRMASAYRVKVLDGGDGSENSGEKWETRQVTWAGIPEAAMFLFQILAGEADYPLTRLLGTSPKGMNATGEHDEDNFIAMLTAKQGRDLKPQLETLDAYLLPSAGVTDPKAEFDFVPIKETTPQEDADLDNKTADTFTKLKATGLIQADALHKVMVAVLDERPGFPGLAEAVAASTEEIPTNAEMQQAEAMNTAKVRQISTPAGGVAKVKRPTRDDITLDAAPRTLYISRAVLNPQEVLNHFRGQGLTDLMAAGDLHVTIAYSETPVDWMTLPPAYDWNTDDGGKMRLPPGGPRVMELFGPRSDTLVLAFASTDLTWRHERLVEAGIEWKWETYQPHITVAKVAPDFDLSTLEPYTGRIVLGPEIFEEVIA